MNLHIDDDNFQQFTGDGQSIFVNGHNRLLNWKQHPGGHNLVFRTVADDFPIIPKDEWVDRIKEKQSGLKELADFCEIKCKDQDGLGYCWVYGSTLAVELIRAKQGQPYIELSPESVGGVATGWRNEGGYAEEALETLEKYGACAQSYMDKANSLRYRNWKAGWQDNALKHRVTEWYIVNTIDEVATLLLNDFPCSVGLNWWGHLVCYTGMVLDTKGSPVVQFRNSWGSGWGEDGYATLSLTKAKPDGAFSPRSVTVSDD